MASVDVYSLTLYREAKDVNWTFPDSTKPVMIAEFSYGATDRGAYHPGPISVADQATRATHLQSYVISALRSPKVVGVTWFQYYDEAATGRPLDGENFNIGFVSVADHAYSELVKVARGLGGAMYILRGR
jgi:hypothetical protein